MELMKRVGLEDQLAKKHREILSWYETAVGIG